MKKAFITIAVFVLLGALVFGAVTCVAGEKAGFVEPIDESTPCPATSCASGSCHSFDDVPDPDGMHEMVCPEAGCASVECHAWDTLSDRYYQASDASLNLWIFAPVAFALGLVALAKRM